MCITFEKYFKKLLTTKVVGAIIKPERRDRIRKDQTIKKGAVSGEVNRTVAGSRFAEIRLPENQVIGEAKTRNEVNVMRKTYKKVLLIQILAPTRKYKE